jgi:hypothetical protein
VRWSEVIDGDDLQLFLAFLTQNSRHLPSDAAKAVDSDTGGHESLLRGDSRREPECGGLGHSRLDRAGPFLEQPQQGIRQLGRVVMPGFERVR